MRNIIGRSWRQVAVVALLTGVDLAVSLPIMGATYRPFSWMSVAPADAATLYPAIPKPSEIAVWSLAIRDMSLDGGKPSVTVDVTPVAQSDAAPVAQSEFASDLYIVLQRSTNLMDSHGWTDIAATVSVDRVIHLIDTNPLSRAVYYRVKQILGEPP